jgi:hypothetical protein
MDTQAEADYAARWTIEGTSGEKTVTEAEWLACTNPEPMLDYLEDKVSARRFRLYHCAVLRTCWSVLEPFQQQAIEATERHFDTANGSGRPAKKRRANKYSSEEAKGHSVEKLALFVFDSPECLPIFRYVFGNPFRPVTISPAVLAWNDADPPPGGINRRRRNRLARGCRYRRGSVLRRGGPAETQFYGPLLSVICRGRILLAFHAWGRYPVA